MRRKQLQDELGLSDEEELPSESGDVDRGSCASRNSRGDSEARTRIKELQRELKEARDAEQKAQESLSKLQLLSKSQTAILKTSMSKKIQQKEALVDDMVHVIKELERKLSETGAKVDAYHLPDSARVSSGRLNAASDNGAEAEINAMKTEMERLIDENSALKAAATRADSNDSKPTAAANATPESMVSKDALDAFETEKRQLMRQVKDLQQQLAGLKSAATPPPAPPASGAASNPEELQALKSKVRFHPQAYCVLLFCFGDAHNVFYGGLQLSAAEVSHQNAQKTVR
jgi:cell division septum initiation protein DivIVA